MKILCKHFALWFPMMLIAIVNGAARDLLYKSALGELRAHQVSTCTLFVLFAFSFWFVIGRWKPESSTQAITVGTLWLVMTLAFEFGFGHFAAHRTWQELFQEYNLAAGRVWVFIPIWVAIALTCFSSSSTLKNKIPDYLIRYI
jgi:hypothetical protein